MSFDQAIDIPESFISEALAITLLPEQHRWSLRIKAADLTAVKKETGLKLVRKIGGTSISEGLKTVCLGPDEWLVISDVKTGKALAKKLTGVQKKFVMSVTVFLTVMSVLHSPVWARPRPLMSVAHLTCPSRLFPSVREPAPSLKACLS